MSKINGIRIINLNYNHNTMKIDDEYFELNGESTLFSLQNGGGKSVLVQMIMAPFVHRRYRNLSDRLFSSYFTTNHPTFIMVEWKLEGGAGYVLTGMMVRKNQEIKDEIAEDELEIITFVHEYKQPGPHDIRQFPVVESNQGIKRLKGFHSCKKNFEELKQKNHPYFNYYDLNNSSHQRNYFTKLQQYQIYHKEWESIIKKINLKESGLSELFTEAKDAYGLVEKWFLSAIEDKLNKEENRIQQFESIIGKYIKQYKENRSKIERKEQIIQFKDETISIHKNAQDYHKTLSAKEEMEQRIAALMKRLRVLMEETDNERSQLQDELEQCSAALQGIHYEVDSLKLYQKEDEWQRIKTNRGVLLEACDTVKKEQMQTNKKQDTLQCAKYYEKYVIDSKEVQTYENKLEIAREKDKDLLPKRNQLGYNLHCYYEKKEIQQREEIACLEQQISNGKEEVWRLQGLIDTYQKEQVQENHALGRLESEIGNYELVEKRFNQLYKAGFSRNILGFYENGYLERQGVSYQNRLRDIHRNYLNEKKQLQEIEILSQKEIRAMEEYQNKLGGVKQNYIAKSEQQEIYEAQLRDREPVLQFLSLPKEDLLDTEKLIGLYELKIEEVDRKILSRELELNHLRKEYKKLESGKVLELPKEFEETLEQYGIQYIYGMEWLKRNRNSVKKNGEIVKRNPFIPYGIIMTKQEFAKLMEAKLDVFTSFPIPVILRESLESMNETLMMQGESVGFYVLFNQQLLDEKQLGIMLEEMQQQLRDLDEKIAHRKDERRFYQEKQDLLKRQTITESKYIECKKSLEILEGSIKTQEEIMFQSKETSKKLQKEKVSLDHSSNQLKSEVGTWTKQLEEFEDLQEQYDIYVSKQDERSHLFRQIEDREKEIKNKKEIMQEEEQAIQNRRVISGEEKQELKEIQNKVILYSSYQTGELLNKDIEDIEAQYNAITAEVTEELKSLEEHLEQARGRFKASEIDLIHYSSKYDIEEVAYQEVKYDRYLEDELEAIQKSLLRDYEALQQEDRDLDVNENVLAGDIVRERKAIKIKYKVDEAKSKESIVIRNFKEEIVKLELQGENYEQLIKVKETSFKLYSDNLSRLSEYDNLIGKDTFLFEEILENFHQEEWDQFRGKMLRDYKTIQRDENEHRQTLSEGLMTILNQDKFQDEFYLSPLQRLFELRTQPHIMLEQLELIWNSYQSLLEKLEVDIAFLGREKEKVAEILLDYVQDIHENLGKIDQNSTINIRGRSIRMLRIKLSDWSEQEEPYKVRIYDFLEEILRVGIALLENNEQIEEMLGKQVTTRNLYDRIAGIGNVEIRLYKIEEQKELQISWEEVAKNSGGEGFLSAFVILSSLLSFMRLDETDIFSEREEGKVLIMDNPFAQTNAAHLLKPLMDVAKKTNTQLICLSGLGGDSIYNRFDHIYVLNLVYSSLKSGTRFLQSEHTKGEETMKELISSQVWVEDMEQMELDLF